MKQNKNTAIFDGCAGGAPCVCVIAKGMYGTAVVMEIQPHLVACVSDPPPGRQTESESSRVSN